jgi:hypothetical protein
MSAISSSKRVVGRRGGSGGGHSLSLLCVGLRTDFDVDGLPEASESTLSLPTSFEDTLPAEVRMTEKLVIARATRLALDGVLKELCRPTLCDFANFQIHKFAFTLPVLKREFKLEAWLYNVLLMYHTRLHCSFTLVLWEDPKGMEVYKSFSDSMIPLIETGYVTLHLAYAMPHWSSSRAKHMASRCSCLLHMQEAHLAAEFHVTLDCDNAMDWHGNLKLWNTLRSKVGKRTELFQYIPGKRRRRRSDWPYWF